MFGAAGGLGRGSNARFDQEMGATRGTGYTEGGGLGLSDIYRMRQSEKEQYGH